MSTEKYKLIANKLKFEGRAYINGKYVDAINGEKFETINPATNETLCFVAKCNNKDVDLAVKVSNFPPSIASTYFPFIYALPSNFNFLAINLYFSALIIFIQPIRYFFLNYKY